MEHKPLVLDVNSCLRVNRERHLKGFEERRLELPNQPKSGAELGM
jgi:hypothetical protein